MPFTRTLLDEPAIAKMDLMDLHIGVVYKPEEQDQRYVAVMLQPSDAALAEDKPGTTLEDWPAVMEVVAGLVDQGTLAWGPAPSDLGYHHVLLMLGQAAGALTRHEVAGQLVQQMRSGKLNAGYVAHLRDQLTRALVDSGRESAEASR